MFVIVNAYDLTDKCLDLPTRIGRAVQVAPMKFKLKALEAKHLKLFCLETAFNSASILLAISTCAAPQRPHARHRRRVHHGDVHRDVPCIGCFDHTCADVLGDFDSMCTLVLGPTGW
jgi:hypothetical protein